MKRYDDQRYFWVAKSYTIAYVIKKFDPAKTLQYCIYNETEVERRHEYKVIDVRVLSSDLVQELK